MPSNSCRESKALGSGLPEMPHPLAFNHCYLTFGIIAEPVS